MHQMDTVTSRRESFSADRRRRVRRLPLLSRLVDVGELQVDIDPLDIMVELDPGFLSLSEDRTPG